MDSRLELLRGEPNQATRHQPRGPIQALVPYISGAKAANCGLDMDLHKDWSLI